jgi:hypothetical protein
MYFKIDHLSPSIGTKRYTTYSCTQHYRHVASKPQSLESWGKKFCKGGKAFPNAYIYRFVTRQEHRA